ncbi:uncharacterized protein LOC112091842 [Morus notabilis]|uniref:uncharacterized protein LOC112091842 n=1 Tax=Morus notabilis TaxID=981085 RepID=UPI000CED5DAE|nr:uncharacterized protein LOC112091842 [Morus notabilis]
MRKFGSSILLPLDSEIERTCRRNRKEKRETVIQSQEIMADPEGAINENNNNIPLNNPQMRIEINNFAQYEGGALMKKTEDEAYELLEDMATNNYQWPSERSIPKKIAGLHEIDAITNLTAQIASLSKQLQKTQLTANAIQISSPVCEFCNGPHQSYECQVDNPFAQNQSAQIISLDVQISQMANMFSERQQGNLPSTSEVNPKRDGKEYCKAVTLRSGKELEAPVRIEKPDKDEQRGNLPSTSEVNPKRDGNEYCKAVTLRSGKELEAPVRIEKPDKDEQRKLHVNIPFAEALEQMPSYVKFMKDILSNKKKLEDYEKVTLTEEFGNAVFEKELCDLGASINLMPLSIFQKLGLGEARPTIVTLQLADRSIKHPRGVIEDVLVKVDKFIFPADFIVLDMEEDKEIPIILGRPFLATGRSLINVQKGELRLQV